MAINKLPVLGTFFANQVVLAGLAGTTYTGTVVVPAAQEVTVSRFALSGATVRRLSSRSCHRRSGPPGR